MLLMAYAGPTLKDNCEDFGTDSPLPVIAGVFLI